MNKIDLNNRVSVDGELQSQEKIEEWYVGEFAQEIKDRLNILRKKFDASSAEFRLIEILARKIEKVLFSIFAIILIGCEVRTLIKSRTFAISSAR